MNIKHISFVAFIVFGIPGASAQSVARPLTEKQVRVLIDSISRSLIRYYIVPEKAPLMSDKLKSEFKKGSYKIADKNRLATRLRADLLSVNPDQHLSINYDPGLASSLSQETQPDSNAAVALLKKENFMFQKVEVLPGNVGYIKFNGFVQFIEASKPTIRAAFGFLKHTDMLIIDLRENFGGSPSMVRYLESYFFSSKTHIMDIVDRKESKTHQLWTDPEEAGDGLMNMPVYILTSKSTASGAEDFAYGMKTTGRAKTVGESTWGGAHPTAPFSLGQGFVASIPFARSISPITKTDWEGVGVLPDIPTPAAEALYTTQKIYLEDLIRTAKDEMMKNSAQWRLYKLKADHATDTASIVAPEFVGVYEGNLDFFVKGGALWCKNEERGGGLYHLKKVEDNLFVLDENVIVQFIKGPSGKFDTMSMLWRDGWVTSKKKLTQ